MENNGCFGISILVADADEGVFKRLSELFSGIGIVVLRACHGAEALNMVEKHSPALVVSDINLPGVNGFELFEIIRQRFSPIRCMLMTDYDVDRYIHLVVEHNVGNILVKNEDFCLSEIGTYIMSLIKGDIFGLKRYFPEGIIHNRQITSYSCGRNVCAEIIEHCGEINPLYLEIAIDELISNAVFHGVLQLSSVPREQWCGEVCIDEKDAISISWARDEEKVGISVEDPRGKLKKNDVLYWLDHGRAVQDLAAQEHGRGFLLVRKVIDRLIVNIDPGKRTECIVFQYLDKRCMGGKKPLLVHELA
ncbi:MAG: response regulator [Chitinispirillaceae bacterium]